MNFSKIPSAEKAAAQVESLKAKRALAEMRLKRAAAAKTDEMLDLSVETPETQKIIDRLFKEKLTADQELFGLNLRIADAEKVLEDARAAEAKAAARETFKRLEQLNESRIKAAKEVSRALADASSALRDFEQTGMEIRELIPNRMLKTYFDDVRPADFCAFQTVFESFSHEYQALNLPRPLKSVMLTKPKYLSFVDQVTSYGNWVLESFRRSFQ